MTAPLHVVLLVGVLGVLVEAVLALQQPQHLKRVQVATKPTPLRLLKDDIAPFIVGGDDAKPGQFPELVSVQVVDEEHQHQHLCGGVIIDPHWVMTAGHCLDQVDPKAVTILAGTTDISAPGPDAVRVDIAGYEIHEGYDPDHAEAQRHDIAVVNLGEPLPITALIQTASLQNVPPEDGADAVVAGWGQTDEGADPLAASSVLQWTALSVMGRAQCQDALADYTSVRDDEVCAMASSGIHAECKGDSGGALIAEGLVIGVVSWSKKPCGSYPGVFSSVPKHYDWIREHTGLDNLR